MDPVSITASALTIVGVAGSVSKGLKKLASLRHAQRDLLVLQMDVSDFQSYVESVSEVISEVEKMTNRPSYQRTRTALERAKETLLELDELMVYHLIKIPDSNGEVDVDITAWFTKQSVIRRLRVDILDRKLGLLSALGLLNM